MSAYRLKTCTSPYLQQHAENPVEWYPWGEEALQRARAEDKPILLSIGYSACHWCHVMAHESFEDPETAALMNQLFINIKVDREERPDLDKIYQSAHQLLAQRPGGWPLTVFLMPDDHMPFFAGTYFPKAPRYGMPAFMDLLRNIAAAYQEQREAIADQNLAFAEAIDRLNPRDDNRGLTLESAPLEMARQQLGGSFDEQHGGFGQAPKFPHPESINRMLRHWATTVITGKGDPRALYMVDFTLTRMALGGFNDQLGGGFYRYSVDDQWMIPHFEKMLYDNGPLISLYSDAWQATGKPLFRYTVKRTADWVMGEMQSPEGGYYSSLDADSEGEEGLFYLWTPEQATALLNEQEYQHLARYYGLDGPANFEGRWHLHNRVSVADLNQAFDSSSEQAAQLLDSARQKLFEARKPRTRPGRDEKILTAWNALMIKGMARAGRLLGRPDLIRSAEKALIFIRQNLWREGRLLATHKDGTSALAAYLDDYAYLIDALLELLQARWSREDLLFTLELADLLLSHFQDRELGGFYFTADDHESLIHRPKPYGDDSIPAGNGIAAFALGRLGHLTGEMGYLEAAERALKSGWEHISALPQAHCSMLLALEEQLRPTETLVIRGAPDQMQKWLERGSQYYAPGRYLLAIPASESELPGLLGERKAIGGTVAYLCRGSHCEAPIESLEALDRALSATETPPAEASAQQFTGAAGSYRRSRE